MVIVPLHLIVLISKLREDLLPKATMVMRRENAHETHLYAETCHINGHAYQPMDFNADQQR